MQLQFILKLFRKQAAGYEGYLLGGTGYAGHLDRDKDGTACEIIKSIVCDRAEDGNH